MSQQNKAGQIGAGQGEVGRIAVLRVVDTQVASEGKERVQERGEKEGSSVFSCTALGPVNPNRDCWCRVHAKPQVGVEEGKGCWARKIGFHPAVQAAAVGAPYVCGVEPKTREGDRQFLAMLMDLSFVQRSSAYAGGAVDSVLEPLGNGALTADALGRGYCHTQAVRQPFVGRVARVVGPNLFVSDFMRVLRLVGRSSAKPFRLVSAGCGYYHLSNPRKKDKMVETAGKDLYAALEKIVLQEPGARIGSMEGSVQMPVYHVHPAVKQLKFGDVVSSVSEVQPCGLSDVLVEFVKSAVGSEVAGRVREALGGVSCRCCVRRVDQVKLVDGESGFSVEDEKGNDDHKLRVRAARAQRKVKQRARKKLGKGFQRQNGVEDLSGAVPLGQVPPRGPKQWLREVGLTEGFTCRSAKAVSSEGRSEWVAKQVLDIDGDAFERFEECEMDCSEDYSKWVAKQALGVDGNAFEKSKECGSLGIDYLDQVVGRVVDSDNVVLGEGQVSDVGEKFSSGRTSRSGVFRCTTSDGEVIEAPVGSSDALLTKQLLESLKPEGFVWSEEYDD